MLPSTNPKASAPRTSTFSVLISPAHPYRYRRFACPLAGTDARLAEKRGSEPVNDFETPAIAIY